MNSVFSEQILADKLSKLNSTQQCIETLSHWCIFHQRKAELVAATWDKQFHSSQMVQKVPLLYLANDILQNSKRKGNEFVTEFWKVLPAALKDIFEKGDDHGKTAVSRLVNIWEERRVFGSRTRSLKEVMLGEEAPPPLQFSSKKRSRSVKIVKRDSRSIRTKLTIGGAAEKIVSAFHLVLSEHSNEDTEMSKCKSVVHRIKKLERDVDVACSNAKDPKRKTLSKELEEEENALKQCIEKLKSVEASRLALVAQLKEVLHEQESELENVRTQMQVAQAQAEEASNMRKHNDDEDYVLKPSTLTTPMVDANSNAEQSKKSAAAIAAEVADKLTASSSSQFIMASVLHTFAAEESKNAGLTNAPKPSNSFTSMPTASGHSVSKPLSVQPPTVATNHLYQSVFVPQPALQNQTSTSQAQYHLISNPASHHFLHPPAGVMNLYGYNNVPPLAPVAPPPPPPPYMVPLSQQPLQLSQQQPMSLSQQPVTIAPQRPIPFTQQPSTAPSFRSLQPPGMVYYGHSHHSQ